MDPALAPPPLELGQVLAAERERQGLSRVDVAQRLHMSPWQVEALENGDYGRLPKGMFLRGFVRNYARALGMDAGAALDSLAGRVPAAPAPGIVVPSQNIRFDPLGQRLASPYVRAWTAAGVAFALACAGTYWWIFVRPSPPAAIAAKKEPPKAPVPQNIAATPMPAPPPIALREDPVPPATAIAPATAPAAVEPPVAVPAAVAPPVAAPSPKPAVEAAARPAKPADVVSPIVPVQATRAVPGARTVKLRFRGSSWVEIRDRSGKVLLSKLNGPGSEAEVSGRPPMTVVVGNAPDVTVTYEDREFPLEPHTKVAVARFTLE